MLLRILAGWRNQNFSRWSVLCLCKSYSVLSACIAGLLQNQAYPVFSRTNPGHAYTGLRLYRLPRQFHPKGTLLCGHRLSQTPLSRLNESNSTQRFLLWVPSVETSPHMNELKGKQKNSRENLIHFHRANLHTTLPFGKPQALTQP